MLSIVHLEGWGIIFLSMTPLLTLLQMTNFRFLHGRNYLIFKIHLNAIDWNFLELHHYIKS